MKDPKRHLTNAEYFELVNKRELRNAPIARPSRSDCWEALRTAVVLAEREMLPGPKLIDEWKQMLHNVKGDRT